MTEPQEIEVKDAEDVMQDFEEHMELVKEYEEGNLSPEEIKEKSPLGWWICPECDWDGGGAPAEFDDEGAGMRLHCPECNHTFSEF